MALDRIRQMADQHYDVVHTAASQELDLPVNKGPAGNRRQRFRHPLRNRVEPCSEPACEDDALHQAPFPTSTSASIERIEARMASRVVRFARQPRPWALDRSNRTTGTSPDQPRSPPV